MTSFKDKVAAAKKVDRKFVVTTVALEDGIAEKRDALMAEIVEAANDPRLASDPGAKAKKQLAELEAREVDSLVEVKQYRSDPQVWANLSALNAGNVSAVCKATVMVDARIIDGETELTQTPDEWEEFFGLLSPADYQALVAAAYVLNDRDPAQRVERLKKALALTPASEAS